MATVPTTKSTGITSTSFRVAAAGFISGLGILITGYVQNTNGEATTAHSLIGGVLALGSVVFKLIHDQGLNKATILAAGSDLGAALPSLRADLSKAVSFVESDLPGVKTVIDGLGSRVTTLESKVPDLSGIESIVRSVLTDILAKQVTPSPPPTA